MNRSSSRLKPLAPKPDACRQLPHFFTSVAPAANPPESKNLNAFAGSHLGVPAGPLENVTSMDPRDYVWGVPQSQPGLYGGPAFASQPLYSPQVLGHHAQTFGSAAYSQAPGPFLQPFNGFAGASVMQPQRAVGANFDLTSFQGIKPSAATATTKASQPVAVPGAARQEATPATVEQIDDLLNTALDDDCIKKLLGEPGSGPSALEGNMFGSCASPCREDISSGPSHNSTATGEGQHEQLSMEGGGVASSVARDLLDATDLHFPMEDTSVLESMSGLDDLDLHLLEGGGLTDVETSSGLNTTCASTVDHVATAHVVSSVISRGLKRAKSEGTDASHQDLVKAGLGDVNPLLSLDLDDALASINGFLAKARCGPEEKRKAAVDAIAALRVSSRRAQQG
ncbi:hypothetical protein WJX73_010460 [Symbiochloris irregularis]|uniref:Uncharacterized protein n=1 Tax=Symbiochloris irregularis TaxID=706552 RepID=A0AAW1PVJ3_9CHLO